MGIHRNAPKLKSFGSVAALGGKKYFDAISNWFYSEFPTGRNRGGFAFDSYKIKELNTKAFPFCFYNTTAGVCSCQLRCSDKLNPQFISAAKMGIFFVQSSPRDKNWPVLSAAPLDFSKLGLWPKPKPLQNATRNDLKRSFQQSSR